MGTPISFPSLDRLCRNSDFCVVAATFRLRNAWNFSTFLRRLKPATTGDAIVTQPEWHLPINLFNTFTISYTKIWFSDLFYRYFSEESTPLFLLTIGHNSVNLIFRKFLQAFSPYATAQFMVRNTYSRQVMDVHDLPLSLLSWVNKNKLTKPPNCSPDPSTGSGYSAVQCRDKVWNLSLVEPSRRNPPLLKGN